MPIKPKRPVGRPLTGRGLGGKQVGVRLSVEQRAALDAHAALKGKTAPVLMLEAAKRAGLFKTPKP